MRHGNSPEKTVAGILGSDEYYAKSGNRTDGFIRALYRDLVGREPTEAELISWMRRMYDRDRTGIAYAFLMRYPQSWQSDRLRYETPRSGATNTAGRSATIGTRSTSAAARGSGRRRNRVRR